jgi:hypothetical protein
MAIAVQQIKTVKERWSAVCDEAVPEQIVAEIGQAANAGQIESTRSMPLRV